jgi:hypothetical protein
MAIGYIFDEHPCLRRIVMPRCSSIGCRLIGFWDQRCAGILSAQRLWCIGSRYPYALNFDALFDGSNSKRHFVRDSLCSATLTHLPFDDLFVISQFDGLGMLSELPMDVDEFDASQEDRDHDCTCKYLKLVSKCQGTVAV